MVTLFSYYSSFANSRSRSLDCFSRAAKWPERRGERRGSDVCVSNSTQHKVHNTQYTVHNNSTQHAVHSTQYTVTAHSTQYRCLFISLSSHRVSCSARPWPAVSTPPQPLECGPSSTYTWEIGLIIGKRNVVVSCVTKLNKTYTNELVPVVTPPVV